MRLRSLLFVPGDRPERFDKAAASGADAIILDFEERNTINGRTGVSNTATIYGSTVPASSSTSPSM